MSRRRLPAATLVLGGLAVFVFAVPFLVDALFGHDVTLMIGRHDVREIEEWRGIRDPADDPAEIYGQSLPDPQRRVLLLPWGPRAAPVRIPEAPERRLLFMDEHPGLHVIEARALRAPAWIAAALLLAAALTAYAGVRPKSSGVRTAGV